MTVRITRAEVTSANGVVVATIDAIKIGGGTAGRMDPQGHIVEVTDPLTEHYQVRLLSQAGPMIGDEMLDPVDTYDEAVALAEAYGAKVDTHAERIAEFQDSLK